MSAHDLSSSGAKSIKIVAVLGAAGSGKSTAADYLRDRHGFIRLRFAQPIKDMLRVIGLTDEQVDGSQEAKTTPCDLLCGHTPRYGMTSLGDWGQRLGKDFFARIMRRRLRIAVEAGANKIVIDDMRYRHEVGCVKEIGGILIAIRRPDVEPTRAERFFARVPMPRFARNLLHLVFGVRPMHSSEIEWFGIEPDHIIHNTYDLRHLYVEIDRIVGD